MSYWRGVNAVILSFTPSLIDFYHIKVLSPLVFVIEFTLTFGPQELIIPLGAHISKIIRKTSKEIDDSYG
jgi:hypothetical protein